LVEEGNKSIGVNEWWVIVVDVGVVFVKVIVIWVTLSLVGD